MERMQTKWAMFRPKGGPTSIRMTDEATDAIERQAASLRVSKADYLEALARADTGLHVPHDPHPKSTTQERRRFLAWIRRMTNRGTR